MEKQDKSSKKRRPQQRPEDAEKQNAQQEREYRKQKYGNKGEYPDQPTDEEAIEDYADIKSNKNKEKNEEE